MSTFKYYPALDGFRFLAFFLVFGFHVIAHAEIIGASETLLNSLAFFQLGWVGVDLFFVLSGFLITTRLLEDAEHRNFFRRFYTKRVLRIFPLYYLVCVFAFVVLPLVYPDAKKEFPDVFTQWPFFLLHLQNWWAALGNKGVFLAHFWSLAIEEQFYLIWPCVFLFLYRKNRLLTFCVAMIVLALALRIGLILSFESPGKFIYFATITRLDALLFGCLLAVLPNEFQRRFSTPRYKTFLYGLVFFSVIYLFIVWPADIFESTLAMAVVYTVVAMMACALIILLREDSKFTRVFEFKPIVYFGKISYGLYVYHWPIVLGCRLLVEKTGHQSPTTALVFVFVTFFLTLIVSAISYHVFEVRFLRLKNKLV